MLIKKLGVVTISSAIALSGLVPAANVLATSSVKTELVTAVSEGQEATNIINVEKDKLIEKARSLFPEKLKLFTIQDFHANFNTYPFENETERYGLHFFKEIQNGKHINGNIEFAGKDLSLVSYHFSPVDTKDALYPPKVSEEQAKAIALDFIKKLNVNEDYRLSDQNIYMNSMMNRPLTEPVEYSFSFEKLMNGIPVQGQNVNVTVLGDGEVTQFFRGRFIENPTYDDSQPGFTKEEALHKLKSQFNVELQYMMEQNYQSGESSVVLAYVPVPTILGIDAISGKLKIGDQLVSDYNQGREITMLAKGDNSKVTSPITKEEARKLAESILKPESDNVKLFIEGILEQERNGTKVYSVQYMYRTGSSGHGSSFEINSETGEILNYHNISRDPYLEPQKEQDVQAKLTKEEALTQAVKHIQQYAHSHITEFAYPIDESTSQYRKYGNEYYFSFPRVKNGLVVNGNGINISVSAEDGELVSLNVNYTDMKDWPDPANVIDSEKALAIIKDNMDVKLEYINQENDAKSHQLFYTLQSKENNAYLDAIKGTWSRHSYAVEEDANQVTIEHPWAAEELNFMIQAKIIEIEDVATFNPDKSVTKGEALNIIYKSLARFYNYPELNEEERQATFTNIQPDHPLYEVIERAAQQNIIDTSMETFNVNETLTREELAFWFARAIGLQLLAEHPEIYKLDFVDVDAMNDRYKGHIALTAGLGILSANENKQFKPKEEVTIAELAVSNVRLAQLATELNIQFR